MENFNDGRDGAMADLTTTGMSSDKDEEERARRRGEILKEIHEWEATLSNINSQITDLTTEQSNLNIYLKKWETQKSIYSRNDILSEVVKVNIFEGVCADKIKADLETCVKEMDRNHSRVTELNDNVGLQIDKLNEHASKINSTLTHLRNELDSL